MQGRNVQDAYIGYQFSGGREYDFYLMQENESLCHLRYLLKNKIYFKVIISRATDKKNYYLQYRFINVLNQNVSGIITSELIHHKINKYFNVGHLYGLMPRILTIIALTGHLHKDEKHYLRANPERTRQLFFIDESTRDVIEKLYSVPRNLSFIERLAVLTRSEKMRMRRIEFYNPDVSNGNFKLLVSWCSNAFPHLKEVKIKGLGENFLLVKEAVVKFLQKNELVSLELVDCFFNDAALQYFMSELRQSKSGKTLKMLRLSKCNLSGVSGENSAHINILIRGLSSGKTDEEAVPIRYLDLSENSIDFHLDTLFLVNNLLTINKELIHINCDMTKSYDRVIYKYNNPSVNDIYDVYISYQDLIDEAKKSYVSLLKDNQNSFCYETNPWVFLPILLLQALRSEETTVPWEVLMFVFSFLVPPVLNERAMLYFAENNLIILRKYYSPVSNLLRQLKIHQINKDENDDNFFLALMIKILKEYKKKIHLDESKRTEVDDRLLVGLRVALEMKKSDLGKIKNFPSDSHYLYVFKNTLTEYFLQMEKENIDVTRDDRLYTALINGLNEYKQMKSQIISKSISIKNVSLHFFNNSLSEVMSESRDQNLSRSKSKSEEKDSSESMSGREDENMKKGESEKSFNNEEKQKATKTKKRKCSLL